MSTDAAQNRTATTPDAPTPAPSIQDLEIALEVQRAQLARDLEELGSRLAPAALKEQVASSARQAARQAQRSVAEAATSVKDTVKDTACQAATSVRERVEDTLMAPTTSAGSTGSTCSTGSSGSTCSPCRIRQVLSDAAAGDRRSLAIATVGVVVLAGVSALALTRANRLLRA